MKKGNWIPLDKSLVAWLPKDRRFTPLEATYSVSVDLDKIGHKHNAEPPSTAKEAIALLLSHISISAYASRWGWSRNKTRKFFEYLTNENGQYRGGKGTAKGHIFRLVINNLQHYKDGERTEKGRYRDTSNYPDTKPDYFTHDFTRFWDVYPNRNGKKVGKKICADYFKSFSNGDRELAIQAATNYAASKEVRSGYARDPIRFLKKDYWRDWIESEKKQGVSEFI